LADEHGTSKAQTRQITAWSCDTDCWGLCVNEGLPSARKRSDKIPPIYDDFRSLGIPDLCWVVTGAYFGCTKFWPIDDD